MKKLFVLAAIVSAIAMFCTAPKAQAQSSLSNIVGSLTSDNGTSAGAALLSLYTQYKADKKIDLSNPKTISSLVTLASNIKGLEKLKNTSSFVSGLISGSKNLVNTGNSGTVLNSLKSIAGLDLSSLASTAASTAAKGAASKLLSKLGGKTAAASPTPSADATSAANILSSLFQSIGK